MSGGSHGYVCFQIEEYLVGQMRDRELDELMKDIVKLAHDLEWADSSDISIEKYYDTIKQFKQTWFKADRETRLKGFIDDAIEELRKELYLLIGEDIEQVATCPAKSKRIDFARLEKI